MRLSTRIALALGGCAVALFGSTGLLQLALEERDLKAAMTTEMVILGNGLRAAVWNALRDGQQQDIDRIISALARVDPSVGVRLVASPELLSRGVEPSANEQPTLDDERAYDIDIEFEPTDNPSIARGRFYIPGGNGHGPMTLYIEKSLLGLQLDLQRTRRSVFVFATLFILVMSGTTWFLVRRYVGVPLARMAADMRRVREDDLDVVSGTPSDDEVGATRREFEELVGALDSAQSRAQMEAEARQRMERALQHADKLITIGQLSAVMAHEVGSPLQVLEGRARALQKRPDDVEATRRTADVLIEQTERITRIVTQLLSTTRRPMSVRRKANLRAAVEGVVALLEVDARRRGVQLMVVERGSTELVADSDQLQQVVLNLVRNALDAAPRDTKVLIMLEGRSEELVLEVLDAGSGIPPEIREHLFEPFFTTKGALGGSGLGLAVVQSIVRDHGGRVELVASETIGCRMRVTLPRQSERGLA